MCTELGHQGVGGRSQVEENFISCKGTLRPLLYLSIVTYQSEVYSFSLPKTGVPNPQVTDWYWSVAS